MTQETVIKKQVRDFLRLNGWFVFHVLQGLGAYPGVSDFIALKGGKVLFLEIKTPAGKDKRGRKKAAGKQSGNQIDFEREIDSRGGMYFVVRSVEDIAEIVGVKLL